jgi:hypothetical protein
MRTVGVLPNTEGRAVRRRLRGSSRRDTNRRDGTYPIASLVSRETALARSDAAFLTSIDSMGTRAEWAKARKTPLLYDRPVTRVAFRSREDDDRARTRTGVI